MASQVDTLNDYVARFVHPQHLMRVRIYRAADEAAALDFVQAHLASPSMDGWVLLDFVTLEESIARSGGHRG